MDSNPGKAVKKKDEKGVTAQKLAKAIHVINIPRMRELLQKLKTDGAADGQGDEGHNLGSPRAASPSLTDTNSYQVQEGDDQAI